MTTDDLKLQRDGHLEYGKVQSKDHAWMQPVHRVIEVTDTMVYTTCDGRAIIGWERRR